MLIGDCFGVFCKLRWIFLLQHCWEEIIHRHPYTNKLQLYEDVGYLFFTVISNRLLIAAVFKKLKYVDEPYAKRYYFANSYLILKSFSALDSAINSLHNIIGYLLRKAKRQRKKNYCRSTQFFWRSRKKSNLFWNNRPHQRISILLIKYVLHTA